MGKDDASEVLFENWGDEVADETGVRDEGYFTEWRGVVERVIEDVGAGEGRSGRADRNGWGWRSRDFWFGFFVRLITDEVFAVFVADGVFDGSLVWSVIFDFWRWNFEFVAFVELFFVIFGSLGTIFVDVVDGDGVGLRIWIRDIDWSFLVSDDVSQIFVFNGAGDFDNVRSEAVNDR